MALFRPCAGAGQAPARILARGMSSSDTPAGERIAKFLSRAGIASRRDAERMIEAGRVAVNGKVLDSPAVNVTARDRVTVDETPVEPPDRPRLWLYHKPPGLVTSARDEKGRETVFDTLPEDMPRVMSVGRLDLNSEGLLLLTNDGELKRRLELPSTGWVRKYRVRVNGRPIEDDLTPLRRGITIEGETFQPMTVSLDRQQGANAWLTVGLREGKNREIRRAMEAIGLTVNRLIRVSYGPFRIGELKAGEVEEVRQRVLRDQLGLEAPAEPPAPAKSPRRAPGKGPARGAGTGPAKAPRGGAPLERDAGKPAGRPMGKPAGKLTGKPAGRPTGKSFGRTDDEPTAKPAGRARPATGGTPTGKPTGKPYGRASDTPAAKSGGRTGAAMAGKPGAKPAGKPAAKPYGKPSGTAGTKPAPRSGSRPTTSGPGAERRPRGPGKRS